MKIKLLGLLLDGAKSLLRNQTTRDVLKYLATITLSHASKKFGVARYKYDPYDMKNMVYHHNVNNDDTIDAAKMDSVINLMAINRFMDEVPDKEMIVNDPMTKFVTTFSKFAKDNEMIDIYDQMLDHPILTKFDTDTLETSSIADSSEINTGGIYIPDRDIITITSEGSQLADAKNRYLEERLALGRDASQKDVRDLIDAYHKEIEFDKVIQYFNNK